jgi:uncharacterized protein YjdB
MRIRTHGGPWRVRPSLLLLLLLSIGLWVGCHDAADPPQLSEVRIEPASRVSLLPGESYQLTAFGIDARGFDLPDLDFTWTSADETVATVSASGSVTARAPGSTLIGAAFGGLSAQAELSILVPVAQLTLELANPLVVVGRPVQVIATVETENGAPVDQPVHWESSDPAVALVSEAGLLTPLSQGQVTITATCGRRSATLPVTVLIPIASLHLQPGGTKLHPGDELQFAVTLTDPEGNPLDGRSTQWSSSDERVATVSTTGLVSAIALGTAFIRAEAEGERDSVVIEVQAPVASVAVTPARATLGVGRTLQLKATPKDARGADLTGRELGWSSKDPAVATVSAEGLVTAVRAGSTSVRATSEGRTGTSSIQVQVPLAAVTVKPSSKDLTVDEIYPLTVTLRSADGKILTGRAVEWSSSNPEVARVSSSGQVTARNPGSARIEATSEGVDGHAEIRITRPSDEPVVFVGAGDIASCRSDGDEATARLLDQIPGTVFTAGDNVYEVGSETEFADCYDPTWGRHKARTRPVPGNHEYETPGAAGYFKYFGAAAGDPETGYYSYDLGAWHILTLNTQFTGREDSPQAAWVERDLAAHRRKCTLALWHVPLFGRDSASTRMKNIYQILYNAGAEIVINGHEHNYQRFAPQTADGVFDPDRGIREFIIGTGGRSLGRKTGLDPNTEAFYAEGFGILKLTLRATSYDWEFVPEAGTTFSDKGSASCH